jgi:hypothetical protein
VPGSFGRVAKFAKKSLSDNQRIYDCVVVDLYDPLVMSTGDISGARVWVTGEYEEVTEEEYDDLCREWCLTNPNYVSALSATK